MATRDVDAEQDRSQAIQLVNKLGMVAVHIAARDLQTAPHGGGIIAELILRLRLTPAQKLRAAQLA